MRKKFDFNSNFNSNRYLAYLNWSAYYRIRVLNHKTISATYAFMRNVGWENDRDTFNFRLLSTPQIPVVRVIYKNS